MAIMTLNNNHEQIEYKYEPVEVAKDEEEKYYIPEDNENVVCAAGHKMIWRTPDFNNGNINCDICGEMVNKPDGYYHCPQEDTCDEDSHEKCANKK